MSAVHHAVAEASLMGERRIGMLRIEVARQLREGVDITAGDDCIKRRTLSDGQVAENELRRG